MRRVLCLWFPNWPIQRLVGVRPELKGQPLVLYARDPRRGQAIVACSREAYEAGVRPGMLLSESTALLRQSGRRPSALHVEPHIPAADCLLLERIAEWCEKFSPIVGLEPLPKAEPSLLPEDRPESLLLDITGLDKLFGSEFALAEKLTAELRSKGYTLHLAVADSVGAAWALAHALAAPSETCEADATNETGDLEGTVNRKPLTSSPIIVPRGQTLAALETLPIATLRLPRQTVSLLHALGVEQIGQLLQLPRSGLASRFGNLLLQRLDQALGETGEVIVAHRTAPPFSAEHFLEYPTDDRHAVHYLLRQLVEQTTKQLAKCERGVIRLDCRLDCVDAEPLELRIDLFRPTSVVDHLMELIEMQLEQRVLAGPVSGVHVRATLTARLEYEQAELFDAGGDTELAAPPSPATLPSLAASPVLSGNSGGSTAEADAVWRPRGGHRELGRLIDRLSSRLGHTSVVRASLCADVLPEKAFRYSPLTGKVPTRKKKSSGGMPAPWRECGLRPLCLFPSPIGVEVLSMVPDGQPVCWKWQGQEHRIVQHWGPERIESGWWRGRGVSRDYYRVRTEQGECYWLFLNRQSGSWFLQGTFE